MTQQNYHCSITANLTAKEAFDRINQVWAWWTKDFEGSSTNEGDVFTIHFGTTYVTFKITEMVTGLKIVWLVTESSLPFLKDQAEWTNTQVVFEILPQQNAVQVNMTHIGLTPEVECYNECQKGWNFYVKESLYKLLTENKGLPDGKKAVHSA